MKRLLFVHASDAVRSPTAVRSGSHPPQDRYPWNMMAPGVTSRRSVYTQTPTGTRVSSVPAWCLSRCGAPRTHVRTGSFTAGNACDTCSPRRCPGAWCRFDLPKRAASPAGTCGTPTSASASADARHRGSGTTASTSTSTSTVPVSIGALVVGHERASVPQSVVHAGRGHVTPRCSCSIAALHGPQHRVHEGHA